jgi:hypothetical protein
LRWFVEFEEKIQISFDSETNLYIVAVLLTSVNVIDHWVTALASFAIPHMRGSTIEISLVNIALAYRVLYSWPKYSVRSTVIDNLHCHALRYLIIQTNEWSRNTNLTERVGDNGIEASLTSN